ncbi:MAG: hypothetical protein MUP21_05205 [Dehalococcoidia bacterium]|nr:hypothetical protein [Dehalococcoidia bacterium]
MGFISVNFRIIGDSYISSEDVSHRLKDVISVEFEGGALQTFLSVNTPHGRCLVIPTSLEDYENDEKVQPLLYELLDAARKEFLELVHLASDPRLRYQEGVNWDSEKLNRRRLSRDSENPP